MHIEAYFGGTYYAGTSLKCLAIELTLSFYAFTINLFSLAVTQVLDTQTRMLQILEGYMQVSREQNQAYQAIPKLEARPALPLVSVLLLLTCADTALFVYNPSLWFWYTSNYFLKVLV